MVAFVFKGSELMKALETSFISRALSNGSVW
jgi:hypothetical protein